MTSVVITGSYRDRTYPVPGIYFHRYVCRNVIMAYIAVGLGVDWECLVNVGFILLEEVTVDFLFHSAAK